ncbi:HlyD family secretion protein [Arenimonas terrae]|uniref:HlyD family efflux transporter periplasmic adaptor subunit n=1 Tax=Arenimonas terrae TaxID=2546226 RepID=A0A5C4RX42_9GAMM|nr:HlyD family efflux transporter periplasmic adaptor subunit [Arenimonas terrae]TNJ35532.1 HlyD family efflux transporter periplasmic adaptor subunit [Arenimonas terrae]
MSLPLFRTEALQARRHSWLGEVVLDQPVSARALAVGVLLACAGVVWLLACGDYTRRTRVVGQLVPTQGLATVVAPVSGVVADLPVQEGQRLLPGDVLAQLVVPGATRDVGNTRDSVERSLLARREGARSGYRAQRERLRAQADGLQAQAALVGSELGQIEAELVTRRQQQGLAEQALQKFRRLHAQRYVTDLQLQQQENQTLDLQAAVQALQRQRAAAGQRRAQLQQALREVPQELAASEAAELRELSALEQERIELRARGEAVVTAPIAGAVGVLFVHAGQAVQAGQPLLALLPASSQLEAHLAVPGAAIGFIAPGDEVRLRYAAYPHQKFGQHRGRVARISRNALAAGEGGGEPTYRVVVALERQSVRAAGTERPLRPGLVLEADILGERRRLWEWLVEPLQTLRGQLAAAGNGRADVSADGGAAIEASAHSAAAHASMQVKTVRAMAPRRGLAVAATSIRRRSREPTAPWFRLATYLGRRGEVGPPAISGLSTRDVPCVN